MKNKKIYLGVAALIIVFLVLGSIFIFRFSSNFKIFRLSGESIGNYKSGHILLAEKVTNINALKKEDAVLYKVRLEDKNEERVGLILALPSENKINKANVYTLDNEFLVGRNDQVKDLVDKGNIEWKIVHQF